MKIVLTGGGSGGHITPLLAVAHELKQLRPDAELIYIGQKGDKLADVPKEHPDIDEAYAVRAGKFRRYSGLGVKQLLYISTVLKNVRDSGRVVRGLVESHRLLKKLKPDVVFIKGGFVGVPVGLAAAQLKIPYVTHDSDAMPGLANRIIAKWATAHAVALDKHLYPYPADKTYTVGVPINGEFSLVNSESMQNFRRELGLEQFKQIIFVTGGGNGARLLNQAVVASAAKLFSDFPGLAIVHLAGRAHEAEVRTAYDKILPEAEKSRALVKGFVTDFYRFSGATDVIIARGSATNLAEFAAQAKPCIIVPATQLAWTVKNAEELAKDRAAAVVAESELAARPEVLAEVCGDLLKDANKRAQLGQNLSATLSHPAAARELAELLIKASKIKNV